MGGAAEGVVVGVAVAAVAVEVDGAVGEAVRAAGARRVLRSDRARADGKPSGASHSDGLRLRFYLGTACNLLLPRISRSQGKSHDLKRGLTLLLRTTTIV